MRPGAYLHDCDSIELMETHISWVLLTGEFVYKIKKPVDFGFLDFSTLTLRRRYCEEEVRLNRRFAESLYVDVVPITLEPMERRVSAEAGSRSSMRFACGSSRATCSWIGCSRQAA